LQGAVRSPPPDVAPGFSPAELHFWIHEIKPRRHRCVRCSCAPHARRRGPTPPSGAQGGNQTWVAWATTHAARHVLCWATARVSLPRGDPKVARSWCRVGGSWRCTRAARTACLARPLRHRCCARCTGARHQPNPIAIQFRVLPAHQAQFRRAWRSARWAAAPQWWTHHAAAARALRAAGAWGRRGIRGRGGARGAGCADAAGARARGGGRGALRCGIAGAVPLPAAWRFGGEPAARQWHERVFIHKLRFSIAEAAQASCTASLGTALSHRGAADA